ncbi:MAG TPA: ABC transporter substrate-binding protein [Gemmatimonadales bacterium]|nr:ABC transporter substrate-binding protein [Gemmatimonadales bacterium]
MDLTRVLGARVRAAAAGCAVLVGAALLGSCSSADSPVRIGIAGPFSQPRGQSMLLAARLAVREINESGGIRGRQLELIERDDSAQTSVAIAIAQYFRDSTDVVAVIGHLTSGTTIAAADIYNGGRNPVVEISPSASNPDLTGIGRFTFRVCATDLVHGTALANFAFQQLNARTAAIIYLNDDYGRGILGTFSQDFLGLGGTIISADPVLPSLRDLSPYLERIQRSGRAQVIMVAGDRATASQVLRQARARGINLPIIGGDGLSGIEGDGPIAEGVYLTSNYLPEMPGEANQRFLQAYAAAYNGARPDHRGAGAYDALRLIAAAVERAGTNRERVRDALAAVNADNPYEGVTGRIAFDDRGDVPDKRVVIGVVRSGRITLAESR